MESDYVDTVRTIQQLEDVLRIRPGNVMQGLPGVPPGYLRVHIDENDEYQSLTIIVPISNLLSEGGGIAAAADIPALAIKLADLHRESRRSTKAGGGSGKEFS